MWIIVGLGNPGVRYKWSRHNIGFQVVDSAGKHYGVKLRKNKFIPAFTGKGVINNETVMFVKPITYMNRSGLAVRGIQELYGVNADKILVVLDDIDLPWGKLRVRAQGSSGGHRGLQSIIKELGTTNFPRLRMGIGRGQTAHNGIIQHVLDRFSAEERSQLGGYCGKALSAIDEFLNKGIEAAMNEFN